MEYFKYIMEVHFFRLGSFKILKTFNMSNIWIF